MLTPGINWRRSGRPAMRKVYSGENQIYGDGTKITAEQLRNALNTIEKHRDP